MIILSQDKTEIINFDNVSFLDIDASNGNYYVMANFDSIYETMGIYPTEERAKEVLVEIINCIENKSNIAMNQNEISLSVQNNEVFFMPEK